MKIDRALYRAADVRELERRAIEQHGLGADVLMERAGSALQRAVRTHFPAADRVLVLCGSGNNGGDGYVLARLLRERGVNASVCAPLGADKVRGVAADMAATWRTVGGSVSAFSASLFNDADLVVDALLGTGIDREVTGELAEVIAAVNAAGLPVLAADIPSGVHADTGAVLGVAIKAAVTVTFIGVKAGLVTGGGPEYAGRLCFDTLNVPASVHAALPPFAECIDPEALPAVLSPRRRDAHKGDFGHVLIVGGGRGMPGAVRLAGEAALRAGAGRVSTAVWPGNVAGIVSGRPELMCRGVEKGIELEEILGGIVVLAAGPGLGQDVWAQEIWQTLRRKPFAGSRVLDADALNWLARDRLPLNAADVITPHPGEAARLLNCTVAEIEADRYAAARKLADTFGAIAVLKGAGSLIASPDGRLHVVPFGNPGMASAGMGDVLTGVIAGLIAQGLAAFDAACTGVLVHALAGDRAARCGERGLIASDVIGGLRAVLNQRSNR